MDVLRLLAAVCAGAAANQAPNTICGTQPAVCNGTFAGRALDLSVSGLTGTLPPELGSLKLTSLDLAFNNISGTLPPELAKLTQLQQFNLSFNNLLSGTVPPGLAKMSQLQRLDLAHTSLSGSIPGNMGQLSQLQRLDMTVTAISGTLPPTLGDLSQLKELTITENGLSGTLPPTFRKLSHLEFLSVARGSLSGTLPPFSAQLEYLAVSHNRFSGTLPRLEISQTLALRNNSFAYTKTSARVCVHNNIECVGVPPLGCSAFANEWRESISNANECVRCDVSAPALAFIGVGFVLVVVGLVVVVRFALRHPSSLKRWVSTATILINHGQTASTIASLRLEWPQALIDLASALRLELPHASCLFGKNLELGSLPRFEGYAIFATAVALVSLVAPLIAKAIAQLRGNLTAADTAELASSIAYAVFFTFSWRLHFAYVVYFANALATSTPVQGLFAPGRLRWDGWDELYRDSYPAVMFHFAESLLMTLLLWALFVHFARNVFSFERGVGKGEWRSPGLCRRTAIAPRRLERQVAFLTGRFARHAPRWQIVIWLRQFLLLLLVFAADCMYYSLSREAFRSARYAGAIASIAITAAFWRAHHSAAPFAFDFQNALESWLYGATVVLLALTCAYTALVAQAGDLGVPCTVVELLMAAVFLGSLVGGALLSLRELRRTRRVLGAVDLSAVLAAADAKIDGALRERLQDGTVLLLRCSWLASPASDAFLGRDASGAVVMKRRQDLPPEAFVPCDEAVAMLERGDRSVLALSYGWLTALHPDPHGTTLAAVRRFLSSTEANDTGLFWDFCSLPQRGQKGEERSEAEKSVFAQGLGIMGSIYASVTGTAVLQQRDIVLPPGGAGKESYNPTPYDGDGGRGWCIFEQGVAMTVLAHLAAAERQQAEKGEAMPERFRRAQASRAKVYDIGGEAPVARECSLPPREVCAEACRAIEKARFTGKADKVMVPQMLAEFEWVVGGTFEQVLQHAGSGAARVAIRPADLQAVARGADKEAAAHAWNQKVQQCPSM